MRKYYILTIEINHSGRTEHRNLYISCYIMPNTEQIKERLLWLGQDESVIITFAMQITAGEFNNNNIGINLIFD